MELHPLAQNFASVAGEYDRGRPDYPLAVVGALAYELGLSRNSAARVLDLGAGTGKLSAALLAAGLEVTAVEPLASLRERLAAKIGPERVLEGTAEQIPLPDASVDAVTVADAFHWFNKPLALAEIRRVLRPGGGLAVISMVPDWSGASWAHELGQLLSGLRPQHPYFDGPPWHEDVASAGGFGPHREIRVTTNEPTSPDRIADHLASMSWVAALPDERRAELQAQIGALVHSGETPLALPQHVQIGLVRYSGVV
ncbi:MAG: class I SAM-dependent methyltransferase [Solirubrobacteraceae bacterium]